MPGQVAVNTIRLLNFDGSNLHDLSNGEMEAHLQIPETYEDVPGKCARPLKIVIWILSMLPLASESRRIKGIKMLDHHDAVAGKAGGQYCIMWILY